METVTPNEATSVNGLHVCSDIAYFTVLAYVRLFMSILFWNICRTELIVFMKFEFRFSNSLKNNKRNVRLH